MDEEDHGDDGGARPKHTLRSVSERPFTAILHQVRLPPPHGIAHDGVTNSFQQQPSMSRLLKKSFPSPWSLTLDVTLSNSTLAFFDKRTRWRLAPNGSSSPMGSWVLRPHPQHGSFSPIGARPPTPQQRRSIPEERKQRGKGKRTTRTSPRLASMRSRR